MFIGNERGVLLTGDKTGDGLHGAGAVKGYDGGDILDALGLEAQANAGHARGLHLEHTGGLALGEHTENLRIVHRYLLQIEVFIRQHLNGIVQHCQVSQAQKVHFQQPQLL